MSVSQINVSEIKQLLLARRAALVERHERVEHDLQRRYDPLVGDSADRAIQLQNDETLQAIDDATVDELSVIAEVLGRLDQGLYGVCKECGGEIEPARLQALHAVTCAGCAAQ
jgi:RNA polymerase-binding transcription factor DksA